MEAAGGPSGGAGAAPRLQERIAGSAQATPPPQERAAGSAQATPPPQERAAGSAQAAPHEVRNGSTPVLRAHGHSVHPALPMFGAPCLPNTCGTLRTASDCMQLPCLHAHDWLVLARTLCMHFVQQYFFIIINCLWHVQEPPHDNQIEDGKACTWGAPTQLSIHASSRQLCAGHLS